MKLLEISPYLEGLCSRIQTCLDELNGLSAYSNLSKANYSRHVQHIIRQQKTADKNFTIAFIGMFNCGKSTIINSLLGLKGSKRLSDKDSPDTAKSIRLSYKAAGSKAEAVLYFSDGGSEECTWEEAKNYTSQVFLDEHSVFQSKAGRIIEVQYFVENPLLQFCDFVDLPGVGTKNWETHTAVALERAREAEVVFWVTTTCQAEPSKIEMKVLQKLKDVNAYVVPFINVWFDKEEGIEGEVSPEELEEALRFSVPEVFQHEMPVIKYYARQIDKYRQAGDELQKEWGLEDLNGFLRQCVEGRVAGTRDKVRRISGSVLSSLNNMLDYMEMDKQEIEIKEQQSLEIDERIIEEDNERFLMGSEIRGLLKEIAAEKAREIVDKCISCANTFIEDEMKLTNFELIKDGIKKKNIEKDLTDKFKSKYLKLNVSPNWVTELVNDYIDDAKSITRARWMRHIKDYNNSTGQSGREIENIPYDFTDRMMESVAQAMGAKCAGLILAGAPLAAIFFIPGGQIVDIVLLSGALLAMVAFNYDPLEKPRQNTKLRAREMISNQKYEIKNQLVQQGYELHGEFDKKFRELLGEKGQKQKAEQINIREVKRVLNAMEKILTDARDDMKSFERGEEL